MKNYLAEITRDESINKIEYLFEIDQSKLTVLKKNFNLLQDFKSNRELLEIVYKNYIDFNNYARINLQEIIKKNLDKIKLNYDFYSLVKIDLNKCILNYLSSVRTYLDHNEKIIKSRFSEHSKEYKNFKSICAKYYDNNFEYRFVYKLRNYCQHCGLPLSGLSLNYENNMLTIHLYFNSEDLINSYDSWSKVKDDLIQKNGNFNALEVIFNHQKLMIELAKEIDLSYENSLCLAVRSSIDIIGVKNLSKEIIILSEIEDTPTKKDIQFLNIPVNDLVLFKNVCG